MGGFTFSAEELGGNEVLWEGSTLAKIPELPGMIGRKTRKDDYGHETKYIELITERRYDPVKRQSRNKRVCIGTDLSHLFPGMMVVNKRYYEFFDSAGNLKEGILNSAGAVQQKETEERREKNMENQDERIQEELDREAHLKDRFRFLENMLDKYRYIVDEYIPKKACTPVSRYQIRRVNELLKDIRYIMQEFEFTEYLQLAEEPEEEGGERMTYGDMAVLLQGYRGVLDGYIYGRLHARNEK